MIHGAASTALRIFSFQVFLEATAATGLAQDSKAQAEQVRAVDVRRLVHRLGSVAAADLARLNAALRTHLQLTERPRP